MLIGAKFVTRPSAPETFSARGDAMRGSGEMFDGAFESLGLQLQNAVSFVVIRWRVAEIWGSGYRVTLGHSFEEFGGSGGETVTGF
jgi:hypothetical protein